VDTLPLVTIAVLGAYHGLNPAMGWLFAVGLGMQDRDRRSVLRALPPIAVGHLASVALTLFAVDGVAHLVSEWTLRLGGFALLAVFAWWRFVRPHAHPRWVGMRIRGWELALWSFLMSTVHGAGVMLLPFAVRMHAHADAAGAAVVVHTLAMIVIAAVTAVVVYEVVGVGILRRGWVNLDRVWAYALGAGAAVTLFLG
jgi:hypothetical protein